MSSRNDCFSRITRSEVEDLWIEYRAALIVWRRVKTSEIKTEKARSREVFLVALNAWDGEP